MRRLRTVENLTYLINKQLLQINNSVGLGLQHGLFDVMQKC